MILTILWKQGSPSPSSCIRCIRSRAGLGAVKTTTPKIASLASTLGRVKGQPTIEDSTTIENEQNLKDRMVVPSTTKSPSWNWIPPRDKIDRKGDDIIPVLPGVLLSSKEIVDALTSQGGEDIDVVDINPKLDTISKMIVVTGRSIRHLRQMSDSIVKALKARGLKRAPGFTGAEGEKDDDWLVVDCFNCGVHFLLADNRRMLQLESHWRSQDKPFALSPGHTNVSLRLYEDHFDELLEQYPVPEDYNVKSGVDVVDISKPIKNVPKL